MSQAFDTITNYLSNVKDMYGVDTITPEQYEAWQKQWILDALAGKRYGQSFCEYFNIPRGTPLYYFKSVDTAERWIKNYYDGK
jgi:hypothetical protein